MAVLERSALAESPLADLHAIASELGVDGFRRLRRDDLIDAILAHQDGDGDGATPAPEAEVDEAPERPKRRRGGRGRGARDEEAEERRPARARGERSAEPARRAAKPAEAARPAPGATERTVEGVVDVLPNGSAFVRVAPPEHSDEDVYISAAQVRRCELVAGDRVSGPVRAPRRSERYPSLARVDAINGVAAEEAASGVRFDDLPAAFPSERFALNGDDPTLKAIEYLTPIGRGSRVTLAGPARAGKSEALRRLAGALAAIDGLECVLVLAGVRPEEIAEWTQGGLAPAASLGLAASSDARAQAVEQAVEQGRRTAARGGDAVVLIDTLDGLPAPAARKALAAARKIADGGSLTVIATAAEPLGGETTVVALDAELSGAHRFPAIDLLASGTLRPELLVGEAGAAAIAEAIAEAAE